MVPAKAVEGRDLAGERSERGGLDILFVGDDLKLVVIRAQGFALGAQLIEAGGLEQHARIGTSEPGDGEGADDSSCDENARIVERDGDLPERSVLLARDKDDVIASSQRFAPGKAPEVLLKTADPQAEKID